MTVSLNNGDATSDEMAITAMETGIEMTAESKEVMGNGAKTPRSGYPVTPEALSEFCNERTRMALVEMLEGASGKQSSAMSRNIQEVLTRLRELEGDAKPAEHSPEKLEADKNAEMAADALCMGVLKSDPESGIAASEVETRRDTFGTNAIAEKEPESFLALCWDAVQDFVLIMLIVLGVLSIAIETTIGLEEGESQATSWIEGAAILISVCIVVLVTAGIDYTKQFAFIRLTRHLDETNTKSVMRDGQLISVKDGDIVVGDILSVNSHSLASIPADCVMLGPGGDLKMDESALTGESKQIAKLPGDVILSGTIARQGAAKLLVVAVGLNSVAGKIKSRVYNSEDNDTELDGDDENSPLFVKLDKIAKQIGVAGTVAAVFAFAVSCIIGLAVNGESAQQLIDYLMVAITVLAVAVPEGLPLAVTLALAFSSNKMMQEQNLVKHLDACETMGCATTVCTDKTGTLTANKMTARALYMSLKDYLVEDPTIHLADHIRSHDGGASQGAVDLLCKLISIDTMDESVLYLGDDGKVTGSSGNPTEVALLTLVSDLGQSYEDIRNSTRGRSNQGALKEALAEGKQLGFSSARKMMSWIVPQEEGGFRLYCKGAQEVVASRCAEIMSGEGTKSDPLSDGLRSQLSETALAYTRRGMRCLGLAFRDLPAGFDLEKLSETAKNSDGTDAFEAETDLVFVATVGIEDPLRPEVPLAIKKCYTAGIDIRMVTGDNSETAVSIAYQAGILRDEHFLGTERVASQLRENVMMEGRAFRSKVYRTNPDGTKVFDQAEFDRVWPYLRVLARSSPDDKLTLAHGLNQSEVYDDKTTCQRLLDEHNIKIFPDRQVVAMTGDGTNDAPALKRADIGFAMGIAGTQIAKDAADIILLDDNFASIVTAARWGRNIYASIQKFLQFQLTVNIAAVVTALVGACAYQTSPLAAIQLLWVNLLMDSLASLALASEPPVDSLLERPPVNRTDHMITGRMWWNMIGQAIYQIIIVMILFFDGPRLLDVKEGHHIESASVHYTLIFNSFVWMQLFNEINSRHLNGEFNVFSGMFRNPIFCTILVVTMGLQAIIVEFGSVAFRTVSLEPKFWGLSMVLGIGSLPWQQVINLVHRAVYSGQGQK